MSSAGKINAALAAAIIFLVLSSFAAYFAFARLKQSQHWVQHTRDVEGALDNLALTTARAGRLRSQYVDSGDPAVLDKQADAVVQVRNALSTIQRLTIDNIEEQNNYRQLSELIERRIALMDRALELKRTGGSTPEAQAQISREILADADEVDRILRSMHADEQDLLADRQQRESTMFTLIAAVLASSLFFALVLFLIHHQLLTDQVSERQRAETAQRALSARLLTLQDEERRRFARELHDSVGQHLSALKMAVAMLQAKLPNDRIVQDCLKLLDDSIKETRTISHLLHPPLLDEAGLNSAMRWFIEGFAQRSGIEVTMEIQESPERLTDSIELVLFRVLQESLTNVHRHSGAKRADVSLVTSGNSVILKVKDYGCGLPASVSGTLREDGTGGGVGLAGMMERVREIGGGLDVNSDASGTEVVATVPARFRPQQHETPVAVQEV